MTPRALLPRWLAILLVSLAGLLLEVGYTRIVSFKLYYYYVYLVIGLALLGIGTGGVVVAIARPLRKWTTERIIGVCSVWGAVSIAIGYFGIARLPIDTVVIWDYKAYTKDSLVNVLSLGLLCFILFSTFIALGVMISVILGRAGDDVGRLYFADLIGAGLGCLLAIPLIVTIDPPRVVALAALIFVVVGLLSLPPKSIVFGVGAVTTLFLVAAVTASSVLPDIRVDETKAAPENAAYSEWGPVFRVDVIPTSPDSHLLLHDATFGSGIWRFDGDPSSETRFETDTRRVPFDLLGGAPGKELIIGSAGGNEILASLYFGAQDIDAVELNPVTVDILADKFADFTGHLDQRPEVDLTQGDGRSFLARSDDTYDLVWYVAPDSYAANNAASSGAFVLSESYLYTSEMIKETLEHLTDDGITVAQFGEVDFEGQPNRTSRYVVTARDALEDLGVEDPSQHILVARETESRLSTIVVKRTPFTPDEVQRFADNVANVPGQVAIYAPGENFGSDSIVTQLAGSDAATVDQLVADSPKEIDAITDDSPFFWHFNGFGNVLENFFDPLDVRDPEDVIGERVLLLLLFFAIAYAAIFLLLPFVAVRKQWTALPAKGISAVYFACLGLGFMFFEITMIQRLTRFLGYPTYSLTVTLASILVFTGLGALWSGRLADRGPRVVWSLVGVLAVLTVFYQLFLDNITDGLLDQSLAVRVIVSLLVLAPLGLCLGMFMPLGLRAVSALTPLAEEYVAWAWAVNGFFSVIGSVLTTILSMTFGFRAVQLSALGLYAIAAIAFVRLSSTASAPTPIDLSEDDGDSRAVLSAPRP
jgi:hypothetical protein